jgi:DNA polymerase (family 10)
VENKKIAKIFLEISQYLQMERISFKSRAYRRAGIYLETTSIDLRKIYEENGLKGIINLPTIGDSIAKKIEEYFLTGQVHYHQKLKKKIPVNLDQLINIEGIGPKTIQYLYQKLSVKNITDLEKMAKGKKIRSLPGFGEKREKNILESIKMFKRRKGRFLLGEALSLAQEMIDQLSFLSEVRKINLAGSIRRMKETIGDIDILAVATDPMKVMDYFTTLPEVEKIWGKGETKSSIRLKSGFDVDLRIVEKQSYGAALQYFTGSKEHNIALRRIAIQKGLKLNEYGVYRGNQRMAGQTEKELYQALKMDCPPPEVRTNNGEIEMVQKRKFPCLIKDGDLQGDLHCHTKWSDGTVSIEEMVIAAKKSGLHYLAITDHAVDLRVANGLNEERLKKQMRVIDKLNKNTSGIKILKGIEANIRKDGSLDISDKLLAELDIVVAGIHSNYHLSRSVMTQRLVRAMNNPNVHIIAHPSGRIIQKRKECDLNWDLLYEAAKKTKTILEINSQPKRLDLKDNYIRSAKEKGVRMVINTDAHCPNHFAWKKLGIGQARRGWAEKKDILNSRSWEVIQKYLK